MRVAVGDCERSDTALIFWHVKTGGGSHRERIRRNGCRNPRAGAFIVLGAHLHLIGGTFYQVVQQCDFVIAGCITDLPGCEILARCRYCVCGIRPCIGSAMLPNPCIVAGNRRFPCHVGRLPIYLYLRTTITIQRENKVGNCPGWFSRVCHRDGNCLVFRSCPSPPFCSCETIRNPYTLRLNNNAIHIIAGCRRGLSCGARCISRILVVWRWKSGIHNTLPIQSAIRKGREPVLIRTSDNTDVLNVIQGIIIYCSNCPNSIKPGTIFGHGETGGTGKSRGRVRRAGAGGRPAAGAFGVPRAHLYLISATRQAANSC